MKKQKLKTLSLNKKKISSLEPRKLHGGILPTATCRTFPCLTVVILTFLESCDGRVSCGCPSIP